VTVPRLLRTLVLGVLQPHFDIDVVAILPSRDGLVARLEQLAPDLVLLGLSDAEDAAAALPLLRAAPTARILALAADGHQAWLYELRPHRLSFSDLSVPSLVRSIRRRVGKGPPKG
jgi:DNA-binding NarL/FixJ family response regulator